MTALFSVMILSHLKNFNKNKILFNIIWMVSLTLAVAAGWEMFEYVANILFGGDAQRVALTGVNDTMQDIIVAFIGGIIVCFIYIYEACRNKKGIIDIFAN